jgi:RNA polymerase sigma factor (sigma-70 family)
VNKPTDTRSRADVPSVGMLAEFEMVYRAEVGRITAFFARRSREPQTVADLTADTFVAAMTSFATFDPAKGAVRGWLFAIARRVYAQHLDRAAHHENATRRHAGRRVLDTDEIDELVHRIDAERAGQPLLDRLRELPPVDRTAVELVDLAGLTPKEAATALGVSPGALRVRLFRARTRLRRKDNDNGQV